MFDLEKAIAEWRTQFRQNGSFSGTEIEELESHLRDSVEELSAHLSSEEAYCIALRRVGSTEALALEFSKINGSRTWLRRAQWMLAGYLLLSLVVGVNGTIGHFMSLFAVYLGAPLPVAVAMSSVGLIATVLLLVVWTWNLAGGRSLGVERCATKFASVARSGYFALVLLLVLGFTVVKIGFQFATSVAASHFFSVEQFGVAAIINASTSWFGHLLLVGTIVGLLLWMVRHDEDNKRWSSTKFFGATAIMAVALFGVFGLMSYSLELIYGVHINAY